MKEQPDLGTIPFLAFRHLVRCCDAANAANRDGAHSVTVCLIRQCVEALTLVDIGLQRGSLSRPHVLGAWRLGKKQHGELRKELEVAIWPTYGPGLWDEPWSTFFGNLARAVQPYAHYTHVLMGWQLAIPNPIANVGESGTRGRHFFVAVPDKFDPVKATGVTLLVALVVWTLARLILMSNKSADLGEHQDAIHDFGKALGRSRLLDGNKTDWSSALLPTLLFKPGYDWRTE